MVDHFTYDDGRDAHTRTQQVRTQNKRVMVLAVMTNVLFYVYMLNAVQGTRQREPIDLNFLQISFGSPKKSLWTGSSG